MTDITTIAGVVIAVVIILIIGLSGFKTIRKTHMAYVETLGKPAKLPKESGLVFVMPFIQRLASINITERISNINQLSVITLEKMNCTVEAQVYHKIASTAEGVFKALYNVDNVDYQIEQLATTTLRNIIGKKDFMQINSQRDVLNKEIFEILKRDTSNWGVEVLKVEIKEITPPPNIQESMNAIINNQNIKTSNEFQAQAITIKAKGEANASIEKAEGDKRTKILNSEAEQQQKINLANGEAQANVALAKGQAEATIKKSEGDAQSILNVAKAEAEGTRMRFTAIEENFKPNVQVLKKLETARDALMNNSKLIITKETDPTLILGDALSGNIVPIDKKELKIESKHQESKKDDS